MEQATTTVSQLCAENVVFWKQYLGLVTLRNRVTHQLAKDHHQQRVKRFAEAFFTQEHPKGEALRCYEPDLHSHENLSNMVRSSPYMQEIPPLHAECVELDGDHSTLPIVFEDIYMENTNQPALVFRTKSEDRGSSAFGSNLTVASSSSDLSRKLPRDVSKKFSSNPVRGSVALDTNSCQLIGYRKISTDAKVEIGTLSSLSVGNVGKVCEGVSSSDKTTTSLPDLRNKNNNENSNENSTKKTENGIEKLKEASSSTSSKDDGMNNVQNGYVENEVDSNSKISTAYEDLAKDISRALGEEIEEEKRNGSPESTSTNNNGGNDQADRDKDQADSSAIRVKTSETTSEPISNGEEKEEKCISVLDLLREEFESSKKQSESEPNLTRSNEDLRASGLGRQSQRLHTSVSTPVISKLTAEKDNPDKAKNELASKVPDKIVRFVRMKEELRSRLDYRGHFYR